LLQDVDLQQQIYYAAAANHISVSSVYVLLASLQECQIHRYVNGCADFIPLVLTPPYGK
jgi:hypothetical protein